MLIYLPPLPAYVFGLDAEPGGVLVEDPLVLQEPGRPGQEGLQLAEDLGVVFAGPLEAGLLGGAVCQVRLAQRPVEPTGHARQTAEGVGLGALCGTVVAQPVAQEVAQLGLRLRGSHRPGQAQQLADGLEAADRIRQQRAVADERPGQVAGLELGGEIVVRPQEGRSLCREAVARSEGIGDLPRMAGDDEAVRAASQLAQHISPHR